MIVQENEILNEGRLETITAMLSPEFRERGLKLSPFFGKAMVLSHKNEFVFVFSSKLEIRPETLNRLCQFHLGTCRE